SAAQLAVLRSDLDRAGLDVPLWLAPDRPRESTAPCEVADGWVETGALRPGEILLRRTRAVPAGPERAGSLASAVLPSADPGATISIGALLLDGWLDLLTVAPRSAPAGPGLATALQPAYDLLQATRRRLSRAEFISCPGCGRLGYDLTATVRRLKARLGHLRDVKIAVMGCAVNGPGEMADADFGYVGSVAGRVDLYVGARRVRRGLSPSGAEEALIVLLREHGRWAPPPDAMHSPPSGA
ncbi:MAG: hypothetical protein GF330_01885, partial [Candidatus Eisenbacteria bacterium]|nr:hypothetical protein [Candidatus Eisenbacteria bacterium]